MQKRVRQGLQLVLSPGSVITGEGQSYTVRQHLGSGAFSSVYLAEAGGRNVAVKEYDLRGSVPAEEVEDVFGRELAALRAAGDHEMIPGLLAHFREGHYAYLVRRYVPGNSLCDLLFIQGRLTGHQISRFGIGLGMALDYLHRKGFVLVDLKPENVIVDPSHVPHLVDLGSVLSLESGAEQVERFLVSEGYFAPELAAAKGGLAEVHPVLDVFALGAVLYHLGTGHRLEPGALDEVGFQYLAPLFARSDLHHSLVGVIGRALSRDPERRYRNVSEMVEDLRSGLPMSLEVYPKVLTAGPVQVQEAAEQRLVIFNLGGGELMGEVSASEPWIEVRLASRAQLRTTQFRGNREEALLTCRPPAAPRTGQWLEAYIQVEVQNAAARVPLRLEVHGRPPVVQAEEDKVVLWASPRGGRKEVWVRNHGDASVECSLVVPEALCLQARPPRLTIRGRQAAKFELRLRPGRLAPGTYEGVAYLECDGERKPLTLEVRVEPETGGLWSRLRSASRRRPGDPGDTSA